MKKIFVLVAGLFLCTLFANAQNNVIDNELQTILNQKNDDYIDINIILKAQMSTAELSSLYCKSDSKEVRRELMVNELKKYSQRTQSDVLSFINAEERNDNVIDVKGFWLTNFINCKAKREVIYQLASHPDVASIVYNGEMEVVSDAIEKKSRGVQSSAEIAQHLTQIKADKAWELGYTGKGVIVAVLDSGVNTEHADLKDHLWNGNAQHGYNVVYPGQDPVDTGSHGTHCAGIVCGDGTSGKITGVAPDATLMSIKLYEGTSGLTLERLTRGIEFAVDNKADILSISQGWRGSYATSYRTELRNTFNNLLELGVIAAVACGNDRHDINSYPVPNNVRTPGDCPPPWLHPDQTTQGGLSSVVSVGAVDENNVVSGISSQGPVEWDDYPYNPGMGLIRPDIVAPGEAISLSNDLNELYAKKAGTSQAAPSVAGVMALMLEKNPELTPADLCRIIETTATKVSEKKNNDTGSGVINALAAVQHVDFNTSGPYINVYSFNTRLTPGDNLDLDLVLINNGQNSTSGNTNVTISTNDSYTTVVNGEASFGVMAVNATATAKLTISIDNLSPDNHKVILTVNATNGSHKRTFDIEVNVSNELLPPNINAQANGNSISLSWEAANNATSYNIYRDEIFIANTESTSYLDEGLEYGTLYEYTVTSKRGEQESEHSKPLRIQTKDNPNAPAPTNVTANEGGDVVNITWTNSNNSGSNIYRKDATSGEITTLASNIEGESYTDSSWNTLQDGVYQYGVSNLYLEDGAIYEEGFESISANNVYNANDANWYYYNGGDGKYSWSVEESLSAGMVNNPITFTPYMGNKAAFIKSYYSDPSHMTYLVTNPMDYTQYDGSSLGMSFHYITPAWGTDINTLKVMVSESYNSGWTELWSSEKTDASEWTKVNIDLSNYIGKTIFIAFVNVAGYGYCTGVDEISFLGNSSKESRIEWSEKIYKGNIDDGLSENNANRNFAYISGNELIINGEGQVQIIDMMGRIVYTNETSGNARINVSNLNKTAYIIRLTNRNESKTQKIVVY